MMRVNFRSISRAVFCSFALSSSAAAQSNSDCKFIEGGFFRVGEFEGLLRLPYGIQKLPKDLDSADFVEIEKRSKVCMPTVSEDSIASKIRSMKDKLAFKLKVKQRREEARIRDQSARRAQDKAESKLYHFDRATKGGTPLLSRDLDIVKSLDKQFPELHAKAQNVLDKDAANKKEREAHRLDDQSARAEENARLLKEFEERLAKTSALKAARSELLAKLMGKDGPADCAAMKKSLDQIDSQSPNDRDRATRLHMAGEESDACEIIERDAARYESARKSIVACSREVAKLEGLLAQEVSESILAKAVFIRLLQSQSSPVLRMCARRH